jgi:serine/threonine-protein kinase HipA
MPDKELLVFINGEETGSLIQRETGRLSFVYDEAWRNAIDSFPISLSIPLAQKQYDAGPVQNYVWGLLPDDPETRAEMARQEEVSPRSPFAMISAYGNDTPGAVQIVPPTKAEEVREQKGKLVRISEEDLAKFLANLVKNPGQIIIKKGGGKFSLPGAQPKKAICYINGRWYEPTGRKPSTHILKPPHAHLADQVENEYFCARLARAVDLRVANTEIVTIAGTKHILVERYDRVRFNRGKQVPLTSAGGTVYRVHQEDFCQSLSIPPDRKYQREGGPSMKDIMNVLSGSGDPATDRERFMKACMFNYVMLGVDAHGKNYSVLFERGWRFRLAPLYDLSSALPYDQEHYNVLAMHVGGTGRWRNIGPRNWEKEANACRYSVTATMEYLQFLVLELPAMADALLAEVKELGLDSKLLTDLSNKLTARCEKLRTQYATAMA